jgi:hypothetical protein
MKPTEDHLPQLLPAVRSLPRADKLRLMQLLVVDLAREEGVPLLEVGTPYPIWTPYHAYDAAATLLHVLEESETIP